MANQSTINKLIEMCLTRLADAFCNQLNDPKMYINYTSGRKLNKELINRLATPLFSASLFVAFTN